MMGIIQPSPCRGPIKQHRVQLIARSDRSTERRHFPIFQCSEVSARVSIEGFNKRVTRNLGEVGFPGRESIYTSYKAKPH
jgi:hypothetical protein